MIAFKGGRQSDSGKRTGLGARFNPLFAYLAEGKKGEENPHRLVHFATRHLPPASTPRSAGFLMSCIVEHRRPDFELPVYHVGASAAPGEELTPAQWEQVADWMLEELGLDEHEAAIFVHDDRGHQHVHVVVNRIPFDEGPPFSPWRDYPKMRRAMRRTERIFGLRAVAEPVGYRRDVDLDAENEQHVDGQDDDYVYVPRPTDENGVPIPESVLMQQMLDELKAGTAGVRDDDEGVGDEGVGAPPPDSVDTPVDGVERPVDALVDGVGGAERFADGVERVADSAGRVVDGVERVADSPGQVVDGVDPVVDSAERGVEGIEPVVERVVDGAERVADSAGRGVEGAGQVVDGVDPVVGSAERGVEGVDPVVERVVDGVERVADSAGRGVEGAGQVVDGVDPVVDSAERGVEGVEPVVAERGVDGAERVADSAGRVADSVGQVVDVARAKRTAASDFASPAELPNQPRLSDGAYQEARRTQRQPLADAIRMRALDDFLVADDWHDLESRLARHGLRLEPGKRGGGVVVWTDEDERVSISRIDRRLSGPKLAKRFGETYREYRERVPERPDPLDVVPIRRRLEIGTPAERADDLIRQLETERATFTEQEVRRHVKWQHDQVEVVAAVLGDRRVQRVGLDDGQRPLSTTAAYRQAEADLFVAADALRSRSTAQLDDDTVRRLVAEKYDFLSEEQRDAVLHATCRHDLALVAGRAGSGKTALAKAVVESYQAEGYRVQGAALGGKAAEGLGAATGIDSRTLASLRISWAKGKNQLDTKSVLLVDEAGMLGTRELAELLAIVEERGAKVILVGDPEQIQAIEAGEAFAGLLERYRGARVDTIRRQRVDWMREASKELAEGRVGEAITAYDEHDLVRWAGDLNAAKWNLVASYFDDAERDPEATRLVFARRNADVDEINDHIRSRRKERGELGTEIRLKGRELAEGDRVVFTKNDHQGRRVRNLVEDAGNQDADGSDGDVGVKNGTLGTLVHASREEVRVQLDDGRLVTFDPREYQDLRVGYAVTLHKGQGVTIDRSFVLLDPYLDRHGTYVAATRHRDHLELWADEQSFADIDAIGRALSRRGSNDLLARASGPTGGALDELREAIEKEAVVPVAKLSGDPDEYEGVEGVVHFRGGFVTTREYLDAENQAAETADRLAQRYSVRLDVDEAEVGIALARAVDGADLAVFEGERDDARALFREIRDAYADTDREILATAFTARAAGELGDELGVESHTFAGLKVRANRLGKKTVLLVDQAHLADTRTMAKILQMADEAGSRVVMVGDPNGFDPLAAGDGFRLVTEGVEAFPLRPEIQNPRILERLETLADEGGVEIGDALRVVNAYLAASIDDRPLILTHRRITADELNEMIRESRRHELGESYAIGDKEFAEGDRVLFTASDLKGHAVKTVEGEYRPEKGEGVRSGALGTIEEISDSGRFRVRLDDERVVAFDPNEFSALDHGYALTTFRANGTRADDVVVLAEPSMDEAAGLVALSSHRRSLRVFVDADTYDAGMEQLTEVFTRRRGKLLVRDILAERHHAPRPTYEPPRESVPVLERHPVLRNRRVEETMTATLAAEAPDPVEATRDAIDRLRTYDRALVALREIESVRADLPHAGASETIFSELANGPDPERRATLERAFDQSLDLDARARRWFGALDGSRDEKVEAVFEASRALGPDGFDQLPAADRALVRDLWEMTIAPIETAADEYERAERELREKHPELLDEAKERNDFYLALATQAALAVVPRPVREVLSIAVTIAQLYRDTPKTLVQMIEPRALRDIRHAIEAVAILAAQPIEAKAPTPEPTLTRPPAEPLSRPARATEPPPRDPAQQPFSFREWQPEPESHFGIRKNPEGGFQIVFDDGTHQRRMTYGKDRHSALQGAAWVERKWNQDETAISKLPFSTRVYPSAHKIFVRADEDRPNRYRVYYNGERQIGISQAMPEREAESLRDHLRSGFAQNPSEVDWRSHGFELHPHPDRLGAHPVSGGGYRLTFDLHRHFAFSEEIYETRGEANCVVDRLRLDMARGEPIPTGHWRLKEKNDAELGTLRPVYELPRSLALHPRRTTDKDFQDLTRAIDHDDSSAIEATLAKASTSLGEELAFEAPELTREARQDIAEDLRIYAELKTLAKELPRVRTELRGLQLRRYDDPKPYWKLREQRDEMQSRLESLPFTIREMPDLELRIAEKLGSSRFEDWRRNLLLSEVPWEQREGRRACEALLDRIVEVRDEHVPRILALGITTTLKDRPVPVWALRGSRKWMRMAERLVPSPYRYAFTRVERAVTQAIQWQRQRERDRGGGWEL